VIVNRQVENKWRTRIREPLEKEGRHGGRMDFVKGSLNPKGHVHISLSGANSCQSVYLTSKKRPEMRVPDNSSLH